MTNIIWSFIEYSTINIEGSWKIPYISLPIDYAQQNDIYIMYNQINKNNSNYKWDTYLHILPMSNKVYVDTEFNHGLIVFFLLTLLHFFLLLSRS